ncbi:MAG: toxin-antitoxin system HicB family antitoxin [Deferrisomatales bacterium]
MRVSLYDLEARQKPGRAPREPCAGDLTLRLPPEVHLHGATMAEAHGMSPNPWVAAVPRRRRRG